MFHSKDGLYFERTSEGGVKIVAKMDATRYSTTVKIVTLDADTWASAVAAVSARGESLVTHLEAWNVHMEPPEVP